MRVRSRAAGVLATTLLTASCGGDGDGPSEGATSPALPERPTTFVERLGADTLAIESFQRTADGFRGTVVTRSPSTRVLHYHATVSGGRVSAYDVEWRPASGGDVPPLSRTTMVLEGDSARIRERTGEAVEEHAAWVPPGIIPSPADGVVPPPLLPWLPVSHWHLLTERLEAVDTAPSLLYLAADAPRAWVRPAVRWGEDSIGLRVIDNAWTVARLDPEGGIASISGGRTTVKVEIEPATTPIDLDALAAEYAERDARGDSLGHPSPPARVARSLAGAEIEITYSRPAKRGRRIWGGLVPYGRVWRTGANAATELRTDRDLDLGALRIPAGAYTLWSVIEPADARLIVNRQTEIWGTQYDADQDFAHVPMAREELQAPVERFTIGLVAVEDGRPGDGRPDGELRLDWDRTRFTVPIRVH